MRWPWQRKPHVDPQARKAACEVAEKLRAVKQRQLDVDRIAGRWAEIHRRDRFAEAVEAALARRHR